MVLTLSLIFVNKLRIHTWGTNLVLEFLFFGDGCQLEQKYSLIIAHKIQGG